MLTTRFVDYVSGFLTEHNIPFELNYNVFFSIKNPSNGTRIVIKPSGDFISRPTYIYHSDGRITIEVGLNDSKGLTVKKFRKIGLICTGTQ